MKKLTLLLFLTHICTFGFAQNRKQIDSIKHEIAIAKEDTNKVRLLLQLGGYYRFNSLDSALIYNLKSLTLAEKINDTRGIASGQTSICRVFTFRGNYPLALEYGFKSNPIYEKLKDTLGVIVNYTGICMCFREQGDYDNAIIYGLKAHKLAELFLHSPSRIKYPLTKEWEYASDGYTEGFLCSVYEKANQLDLAIKYGEKAYETRKNWSGLLYPLANAYAKKGQNDKALHYFKLGLSSAIKANYQKDKLEILTGMSDVFKQKGAMDSATIYSKKVLTDKYSKNFPSSLLLASTQLANIYESQNKTDSAFKYLKQSIALKDTLFNKGKTIAMQNLIFKEDQKKKELEEAELKFQNRLKIYALIVGLAVLLLLSFLLWRRNLYKQKAYNLLQSQKRETDSQKVKVEQTLEKLKSTQNQLIQSEKLASLGELTAGIAHEIQNPLNFVNNFSEVSAELIDEMNQEMEKGEINEAKAISNDLKKNLEKIIQHGKRASSIVKGMLMHSRTSAGKKELTDINNLTDEFLRLAYHGLRAKDKGFNADFKTDLEPNLPKIEVVPQDIGRVLMNLINNAFQAPLAPNGRTKNVVLKTFLIPPNEKSSNRGWVVITVSDNGMGMSPETKAKIFQPFFTTKPTGQGTGLGLSISFDIIKAHGGELIVQSTEGQGTEFTIKLPIIKE